jgi:hypothetical protein
MPSSPGGVDGERIQRAFRGAPTLRADAIKDEAISNQSLEYLVDPRDIAA